MVKMFDQLWTWLMTALQPYGPRPYSTIFIAAVAFILSLTTNLANRLLVDVERMKSVMEEVKAWRREYELARKTNNKQLMAKVMKRQKAIMQLQGKASWDRMKVSLTYIGPFWIIFYILSSFFQDTTVALSPFTFPYLLGEKLPFISWYIICSLAMSLPMSRLLGANPEMG
ncbi:MAG: EMC3/TMCO1 family protein [Candidatus Bathyarchaeia archaeon]